MRTAVEIKALMDKLKGKHEREYRRLIRSANALQKIDKQGRSLTKALKQAKRRDKEANARYSPLPSGGN